VPADSEVERDAVAIARRDGEPLASPLARRVAESHGIVLGRIEGSGPRGRIRRRDVERTLAAGGTGGGEVLATSATDGPAANGALEALGYEVVSMSAIRRTIARRLHASVQDTAQMTDIREQDVSAVVEMRSSAIARAEELGFRLSFTAIFAKAAVMALEAVPLLNSTLVSEAELHRYEEVNLGMAVSIPDGLVVPVVRGAGNLSLRRLDAELKGVIARARDRSASAADLSGGTFTLTNFGSYGSHMGTPILMPPQVGILGIGALLDRPVVRDGELGIGKSMYTSLTVDHRVIDGEAAGLYQNELARLFAEPDLLLYG
jgi:pyruvate/2-oxoglutarate dehydrogenase complex dihydrolipoamide acyltransferase (E2) component